MKAPAPDTRLVPRFRNRIPDRSGGRPLIESRFEQANQRHLRHSVSEKPDACDVWWIMRRRNIVESLHRFDDGLVQPHTAVHPARHNGLKADRRELFLGLYMAAVF